MDISVVINAKTVKKLRKLRLWHWRQAMAERHLEHTYRDDIRKVEEGPTKEMYSRLIDISYSLANHHIGCVQTLNDFFPRIGDTAENDAELEARKLTNDNA